MAEAGPWLGGWLPGGVHPYCEKGRQVGWQFKIKGAEAEKLPRDAPRSKKFSFSKFGEDAETDAKNYQRRVTEDRGLLIRTSTAFAPTQGTDFPISSFTSGTGRGRTTIRSAMLGISRFSKSTRGASRRRRTTSTW